MKLQRLALWLGVTIAAGLALLYGGANLAARWASFALSNRFFGLDPEFALAIDGYFVWGGLALLIGAIVGTVLRSRPVLAAFTTCATSAAAFAILAFADGLSLMEMSLLYAEPLIASLAFTTLGALLAVRRLRP